MLNEMSEKDKHTVYQLYVKSKKKKKIHQPVNIIKKGDSTNIEMKLVITSRERGQT